MSIEKLREVLAAKVTDSFEEGDVIRWVASSTCNYAAIKTPVGWFTTASEYNGFVAQRVSWEDLLEILQRADVSAVSVATEWEHLG